MSEQEVLEKLTSKIEETNVALLKEQERNVFVKGKAGSGKTFLLLTRVAYLLEAEIAEESEMLNITTSVEMAKDMTRRYRLLHPESEAYPQFCDIHQIAYRLIRNFDKAHEQETWKAYRDVRKLVHRLIKEMFALELSEHQLLEVMEKISYCRNMILPEREIAKITYENIDFPAFLKSYEKYKQRHHIYDYDDLLFRAFDILMKQPEVLENFQHQYQFIHVDDAQNLSYLSHVMLKVLAKNCKLFICADLDYTVAYDQIAYKEALLNIEESYPDILCVELTHNYRNNKTITETANLFFYKDGNGLCTDREEESDIRYKGFSDTEKLYAYAMRKTQEDEEEVVFLYHDFATAIPLIECLKNEGICFMYEGSIERFSKHAYVRDMCNFIELMIDARDMRAFYEIHAKMGLDVSKRVLLEISERLKQDDHIDIYQALMESSYKVAGKKKLVSLMELIRMVQHMSTERMIYFIQEKLEYQKFMRQMQIANNDAIVIGFGTLAHQYENPEEFLYKLNELNEFVTPNTSRIQIRSIEGSAGKEFDRVYMLDCMQSVCPGNKCTDETLRRERELFYMGITRARNHLEFLAAKRCSVTRLEISSFLYELNQKDDEDLANKPAVTVQKKLREGALKRGVIIIHATLGRGKIMKVVDGMMHVQFADELKQLNVKMCVANKLIELV